MGEWGGGGGWGGGGWGGDTVTFHRLGNLTHRQPGTYTAYTLVLYTHRPYRQLMLGKDGIGKAIQTNII